MAETPPRHPTPLPPSKGNADMRDIIIAIICFFVVGFVFGFMIGGRVL